MGSPDFGRPQLRCGGGSVPGPWHHRDDGATYLPNENGCHGIRRGPVAARLALPGPRVPGTREPARPAPRAPWEPTEAAAATSLISSEFHLASMLNLTWFLYARRHNCEFSSHECVSADAICSLLNPKEASHGDFS